MKRIIASAGLVALGAASVQAAYTPGLTPAEKSKPWSVSLAVRGFYDDNMFARPDGVTKEDSFGVSVNPTVGLNFALDRTLITFNYSYDFRWFEARKSNEADHIQIASAAITHSFSERLSVGASDRFVYAQEGTVLLDAGPVTAPGRSNGDYFRNIGRASVNFGATERLGFELAYQNQIYDYEDAKYINSYSARLDRMEHLITIEGALGIGANTKGLLGYQFGDVGMNSGDQIIIQGFGLADADVRDRREHYIYAGLDHNFSPQLNGAIRAGVLLTDYTNADVLVASGLDYDDSSTVPYIDARLSWTYNPGSSLTLGVVNTINATDVASALSQNSVAVYANLQHRITPKWTLGAMGLYQHSSFEGGAFDGDKEQLVVAGVNVNYEFNPNLSAEAGYNYDLLDSDLDDGLAADVRGFDRNRVYVGLRARF
jgi:predicted porin